MRPVHSARYCISSERFALRADSTRCEVRKGPSWSIRGTRDGDVEGEGEVEVEELNTMLVGRVEKIARLHISVDYLSAMDAS